MKFLKSSISLTDKAIILLAALTMLASLYLLINFDQVLDFLEEQVNTTPQLGVLESQVNDVRHKSAVLQSFRTILINHKIRLGDSIFCGVRSQAAIRMTDGTEILVSENSLVTFNNLQSDNLPNFQTGLFNLTVNGRVKVAINNKVHTIQGQHSKIKIEITKDKLAKVSFDPDKVKISSEPSESLDSSLQIVEIHLPENLSEASASDEKNEKINLPPIEIDLSFKKALRQERRNGLSSKIKIKVKNYEKIISLAESRFEIFITLRESNKDGPQKSWPYKGSILLYSPNKQKGSVLVSAYYKNKTPEVKNKIKQIVPAEQVVQFKYHDDIKPPTPALLSPKNNYTLLTIDRNNVSQIFRWKDDQEVRSYEIEISDNQDFKKSLRFSAKEKNFKVDNTLKGGSWYWRVRSYNKYVESNWSKTHRLVIYQGQFK